jgi:NAD(P)H-hydrate repair Nnr-like enzyme with NAD(P)H-hydrate dehydratase domain
VENTYWQKQTDKPLFLELEWNKPERRDQAGHLLILGGTTQVLTAPAKAYELTKQCGIGTARVALPEKAKKLVGHALPEALFLPSTSHGELSQEGIDELLAYISWADTLLLPGDIGRNSQTAVLLEELMQQTTIPTVITKDAIEVFSTNPNAILERAETVIIVSFSQLQRMLKENEAEALQFSMGLVKLVDYLHDLTARYPSTIVTCFEQHIIVAQNGFVSTTKLKNNEIEPPLWQLSYACYASCYLTWYPKKQFEALTHCATLLQ